MAAGLTASGAARAVRRRARRAGCVSHKEELFNLRFQVATGQLDNNRRLQTVRRDIARIYTIMRERELGLSVAPNEGVASARPRKPVRSPAAPVWPVAGYRKVREGLVVSDKMEKTIVVEVEDRVKHGPVRQGHPPYEQAEGPRRAEHRRHRRPRADHGDPAHCRPPSGGGWSRSSRRPSKTRPDGPGRNEYPGRWRALGAASRYPCTDGLRRHASAVPSWASDSRATTGPADEN